MRNKPERKLLTVEATEKPRGEIDFRIAATRMVMMLDLGSSRGALATLVDLEKEAGKANRTIEFFGDPVLASAVRQAIVRCEEGNEMEIASALKDKFAKYVKIR